MQSCQWVVVAIFRHDNKKAVLIVKQRFDLSYDTVSLNCFLKCTYACMLYGRC